MSSSGNLFQAKNIVCEKIKADNATFYGGFNPIMNFTQDPVPVTEAAGNADNSRLVATSAGKEYFYLDLPGATGTNTVQICTVTTNFDITGTDGLGRHMLHTFVRTGATGDDNENLTVVRRSATTFDILRNKVADTPTIPADTARVYIRLLPIAVENVGF